jgi:hypothetical protein
LSFIGLCVAYYRQVEQGETFTTENLGKSRQKNKKELQDALDLEGV